MTFFEILYGLPKYQMYMYLLYSFICFLIHNLITKYYWQHFVKPLANAFRKTSIVCQPNADKILTPRLCKLFCLGMYDQIRNSPVTSRMMWSVSLSNFIYLIYCISKSKLPKKLTVYSLSNAAAFNGEIVYLQFRPQICHIQINHLRIVYYIALLMFGNKHCKAMTITMGHAY